MRPEHGVPLAQPKPPEQGWRGTESSWRAAGVPEGLQLHHWDFPPQKSGLEGRHKRQL